MKEDFNRNYVILQLVNIENPIKFSLWNSESIMNLQARIYNPSKPRMAATQSWSKSWHYPSLLHFLNELLCILPVMPRFYVQLVQETGALELKDFMISLLTVKETSWKKGVHFIRYFSCNNFLFYHFYHFFLRIPKTK